MEVHSGKRKRFSGGQTDDTSQPAPCPCGARPPHRGPRPPLPRHHSMCWQIMGKGGDKPSGELAAAIDRDLGGLEKMQNDFNAAGGRVFGSGWGFWTGANDG